LGEIARLCVEFGVIAVTDEIYEYILYDGCSHTSLGSLDGMQDRAVTISGLGKTYAVTGWRVGWAVASAPLTARIRKVHDYLTICAPAPFQAAGIAALSLPGSYYEAMRRQYAQWRALLLSALDAAGFTYLPPEGAYYVMADFSRLAWDQTKHARPTWPNDRTFAEYLARDIGVAVVPGSSFYAGGRGGAGRVRFNFAKRAETLIEAARRLTALHTV
jgi:aminotransferase